MKLFYLIIIHFLAVHISFAQPTPFILKGALKENRQQLYRNLINNTIQKNLSLPLNIYSEEQWQDAFAAMEMIGYHAAWSDTRIHAAFDSIEKRSTAFQRSLLELAFTSYPDIFFNEIKSLWLHTTDAKVFAMCAVYLLAAEKGKDRQLFLPDKIKIKLNADSGNPILQQLQYQVQQAGKKTDVPSLKALLQKGFLPGNVVLFSFQRSNRNYPGVVIIRDGKGNFMIEAGHLFFVPQLARSISNLPGYLTNGNTPQGIFKMDGFDTSMSSFIGPTTNIQLTMPYEDKAGHYFTDSTLNDSSWNIDRYNNLWPAGWKNYYPVREAWYAGKAGRTAIIAHGTAIDPAYYKNSSYYPLTPTLGCLCTKEIWNAENGRLMESDQQKLADAVIRAGGPHGYAVVINMDDQEKEVGIGEIINLLQTAN